MGKDLICLAQVIVITSGKGGVGKTTTTCNLGIGLAQRGQSVVMVDTDIGLRNLDVLLGLESLVVDDLVDVAEGSRELSQALVKDPRVPGLSLLPAAQTRDKRAVTPAQMVRIVDELRGMFNFVLIDCPAGIEQGFENAVAAADAAIVVTNPEIAAVRDADRIIGLLAAHNITAPRLIVNRLRPKMVKRGDMMDIQDILDLLGIDLLGVVPDDEAIIRAGNLGEPVVLAGGAAAKAYQNIAARILGEDVPLSDLTPDTFWSRFTRRLQRR